MTIHSLRLSSTVFALLLGMSSLLSQAADEVPIDMSAVQLVPQQQNGITYLSGGIGIDETEAIKQEKGYTLHLTFSTGSSNEYIPNIDVVIQKPNGDVVVSMNQIGPIAYVKLPAGSYVIISSKDGKKKEEKVVVDGNSVRTVNVHWSDEP
ncbi:MAG: hypothetical protein JWP80_2132 [Pseudomonas sp.]|nr:hypothetical protein [Pseudomonas sp.]